MYGRDLTLEERKKFLAQKGMCFNCTGTKHHAADCRSRARCQKCGKKDNTYICAQKDQLLTATATCNKERVVYPIVQVNVGGVMCRALEPGALMPQQYSWTRLLNARVPEKFDASK